MSSVIHQEKDLSSLFEPNSVAVVGASTNPEKIGHKILKNIVEAGFKGKVYPINPRSGEILGLKTYTSILDIPGELETVVIVIPARFVPSVIKECVKKRVKGAIIISSGFRDVGPEGANLEREIIEIAKSCGLIVIGPNCQGLSNPAIGFCATWPIIKEVGNVAVISQSGTVALEVPTFLAWNNLGYSKSVSLGNKADVDEADLISWLSEDDNTRVISVFTEGMKDGRKLMNAVKKASTQKPVLILKGGKSEAGKRAVLAHTGTLAGNNSVFEAAMKQSGGLCLDGLEELCYVSKAFSSLPIPKGNRLLVISSSGGAGILSVDSCEEVGLVLSNLSEQTLEKLKNTLPEYCIIGNPLDLTGNALSNPNIYGQAMEIVLDDNSVDMILVIFGDPIPNSFYLLEKQLDKGKKLRVPIAINYLGGADIQEKEIKNLQKNGVPVFQTPNTAIKALSYMYRYGINRMFKDWA